MQITTKNVSDIYCSRFDEMYGKTYLHVTANLKSEMEYFGVQM